MVVVEYLLYIICMIVDCEVVVCWFVEFEGVGFDGVVVKFFV